ncbi:isomerase [Mycobacterium sp.]|uniref:isomerase n=1 Tax=Mycobacterium sp. TaxID=1785 RepID=UPI0025DDDD80|nr:isomerase [Mycobacterium sp.]
MKPYKIDPDVLAQIAKDAIGRPLDSGERLDHVVEMISAAYPHLIAPVRGRWVGNKAGGILGKVSMVYFSPREYIVLFGSPTGTQGFSGRYKHVEIHKFLLAGQIDSYDLESDQISPSILRPGERTCLEKGHTRGLTIHPGSWHLEYGRGAVATTLPFAMAETLLTSLELPSMVLSTKEFVRLVRRRPDR